MTIDKKVEGNQVIMGLSGRLDTTTAPELQAPLMDALADNDAVTLDFADLQYVSSAGLRVLMMGQKYAATNGKKFIVKNVSEEINEVFEMTGFTDILTIE